MRCFCLVFFQFFVSRPLTKQHLQNRTHALPDCTEETSRPAILGLILGAALSVDGQKIEKRLKKLKTVHTVLSTYLLWLFEPGFASVSAVEAIFFWCSIIFECNENAGCHQLSPGPKCPMITKTTFLQTFSCSPFGWALFELRLHSWFSEEKCLTPKFNGNLGPFDL